MASAYNGTTAIAVIIDHGLYCSTRRRDGGRWAATVWMTGDGAQWISQWAQKSALPSFPFDDDTQTIALLMAKIALFGRRFIVCHYHALMLSNPPTTEALQQNWHQGIFSWDHES